MRIIDLIPPESSVFLRVEKRFNRSLISRQKRILHGMPMGLPHEIAAGYFEEKDWDEWQKNNWNLWCF
ncbi:MAG TPA: hypothetical protein VF780_02570 [Nitrosospira sp.]